MQQLRRRGQSDCPPLIALLQASKGLVVPRNAAGRHRLTPRRAMSATFDVYPYDTPLLDIDASMYRAIKYVHWIRHAEGTHNVNMSYRDVANLDARLTDYGVEQCHHLAKRMERHARKQRRISDAALASDLVHMSYDTDLVVTSPLTRCVQTTLLSMQPLLDRQPKLPILCHEDVRETVNFNCDRRRSMPDILSEHDPHGRVDITPLRHPHHDVLWQYYVDRLGDDQTYRHHRESAELYKVADRGRHFLSWLMGHDNDDNTRRVVVCTHAALLRCWLNFGHDNDAMLAAPPQTLDDRVDGRTNVPVLRFCGDSSLAGARWEQHVRQDFDNCEMRSMIVALPR